MVTKVWQGPELKYEYDKLVDEGYVSRIKHHQHPIYLYLYTNKTVLEKKWNSITKSAKNLVLDEKGNIVSKGIPKVFVLEEMSVLPATTCTVYEQIDGIGVTAFWHEGKIAFHTKNSFTDVYSDYMAKYKTFLFNRLRSYKSIMCELVLPGRTEKNVRIINNKPGVYILGATSKNGVVFNSTKKLYDLDILELMNQWDEEIPRLLFSNSYSKSKTNLSEVQTEANRKNIKGYIARFKDPENTRVKVISSNYLEKVKKLMKINDTIRNNLFEGKTLDDILRDTDEAFHDEIRIKVTNIFQYMDEQKYIINKSYRKLYTSDPVEFEKSIDHYGNRKKYFIFSYNEKPWTSLLLNDAIIQVLKNV